ncbi:family 16 glycosylhydrolase [Marivirga sp. S37H4]|uniref:Family 16 glycosylhydrolase n=1 Tax=Marivirga aurantiaca TaxID=2802615 RepID=A0A934WWS4_9BACT|nr:family 16 glycosylhydrolase [Marivirga aurantiaca]MBK6264301.1 family 16 glycosylhydrolase [Marivirga aurantiaca]
MLKLTVFSFLFLVIVACDDANLPDDRLPEVTAEPLTIAETDQNQEITIDLMLDKPSTQEIIVNYSTKNGTALAGSDYRSIQNENLTIPPGDLSASINLTILGDEFKEDEEIFYINLTSAINASISTEEIEIKITDTDTLEEPGGSTSFEGYESPLEYEGYELVWQDEFEADQLSDDYTFEIGTGGNGWGNNESQYYREENTRLEDGYLVIRAKKENFGGREYTSSRIITENKKEFKYGRFDIRARMPYGQGIWPAIWMLGANFREVSWPYCGEIDIMEMIGGQGRERIVHGTVHWDSDNGYANYGHSRTLSDKTLSDQFHVFSIIWDENSIEWLIDNQSYGSIDTTPSHLDEFREEFFFIFNVAVGGNWPGYPDEFTEFPQEMWIDYVRVFQQP